MEDHEKKEEIPRSSPDSGMESMGPCEDLLHPRRVMLKSLSQDSEYSLDTSLFDAEEFLQDMGFAGSADPIIPDRFLPSLMQRLSRSPESEMESLHDRIIQSIGCFRRKVGKRRLFRNLSMGKSGTTQRDCNLLASSSYPLLRSNTGPADFPFGDSTSNLSIRSPPKAFMDEDSVPESPIAILVSSASLDRQDTFQDTPSQPDGNEINSETTDGMNFSDAINGLEKLVKDCNMKKDNTLDRVVEVSAEEETENDSFSFDNEDSDENSLPFSDEIEPDPLDVETTHAEILKNKESDTTNIDELTSVKECSSEATETLDLVPDSRSDFSERTLNNNNHSFSNESENSLSDDPISDGDSKEIQSSITCTKKFVSKSFENIFSKDENNSNTPILDSSSFDFTTFSQNPKTLFDSEKVHTKSPLRRLSNDRNLNQINSQDSFLDTILSKDNHRKISSSQSDSYAKEENVPCSKFAGESGKNLELGKIDTGVSRPTKAVSPAAVQRSFSETTKRQRPSLNRNNSLSYFLSSMLDTTNEELKCKTPAKQNNSNSISKEETDILCPDNALKHGNNLPQSNHQAAKLIEFYEKTIKKEPEKIPRDDVKAPNRKRRLLRHMSSSIQFWEKESNTEQSNKLPEQNSRDQPLNKSTLRGCRSMPINDTCYCDSCKFNYSSALIYSLKAKTRSDGEEICKRIPQEYVLPSVEMHSSLRDLHSFSKREFCAAKRRHQMYGSLDFLTDDNIYNTAASLLCDSRRQYCSSQKSTPDFHPPCQNNFLHNCCNEKLQLPCYSYPFPERGTDKFSCRFNLFNSTPDLSDISLTKTDNRCVCNHNYMLSLDDSCLQDDVFLADQPCSYNRLCKTNPFVQPRYHCSQLTQLSSERHCCHSKVPPFSGGTCSDKLGKCPNCKYKTKPGISHKNRTMDNNNSFIFKDVAKKLSYDDTDFLRTLLAEKHLEAAKLKLKSAENLAFIDNEKNKSLKQGIDGLLDLPTSETSKTNSRRILRKLQHQKSSIADDGIDYLLLKASSTNEIPRRSINLNENSPSFMKVSNTIQQENNDHPFRDIESKIETISKNSVLFDAKFNDLSILNTTPFPETTSSVNRKLSCISNSPPCVTNFSISQSSINANSQENLTNAKSKEKGHETSESDSKPSAKETNLREALLERKTRLFSKFLSNLGSLSKTLSSHSQTEDGFSPSLNSSGDSFVKLPKKLELKAASLDQGTTPPAAAFKDSVVKLSKKLELKASSLDQGTTAPAAAFRDLVKSKSASNLLENSPTYENRIFLKAMKEQQNCYKPVLFTSTVSIYVNSDAATNDVRDNMSKSIENEKQTVERTSGSSELLPVTKTALADLKEKSKREVLEDTSFWHEELEKVKKESEKEWRTKLKRMESLLASQEEELMRIQKENELLQKNLETQTIPPSQWKSENGFGRIDSAFEDDEDDPNNKPPTPVELCCPRSECDRLQKRLLEEEERVSQVSQLLDQKVIQCNKLQITISKQTKEMIELEKSYMQLQCRMRKVPGVSRFCSKTSPKNLCPKYSPPATPNNTQHCASNNQRLKELSGQVK